MSLMTTINESGYRLVSVQGNPQDAGFVLVRALEHVHATSADTIATTLNTRRQYTNPKADRQTLSGTYIQSRLEPKVRQSDAVDIEQTLVKVRSTIVDSEATLLSAEGNPTQAGYSIERGWLYFNPNTADTAAVALSTPDTVVSPKADRQTYSGNYVNTYVRTPKAEDRTVTIIQRLTKGKRATDSADADLIQISGDPQQAGSSITRAWRYVLPQAADGLVTALDAKKTYPAGVKADEQLYSGRYVNTSSRSEAAEDRTVTIRQTVTKVATATDSVSARFVSLTGDPQRAGTSLVRQWPYIDPIAADGLMTTLNTVPTYASGFRADSQAYSGIWIHSKVDGQKEEDQTATIRQTLVKVRSTIVDSEAVLMAVDGNPTQAGFVIERAWPYFNPNTADTAVVALNAIDTVASPKADKQTYSGNYVASYVRPDKAQDRTVTIVQHLVKAKRATDSADADLVELRGDPQEAGSSLTRSWRYIIPQAADGLVSTLDGKKTYPAGVKADEQLYSGKYVNTSTGSEPAEDRTVTIRQVVTKVATTTDSTAARFVSLTGDPNHSGTRIVRRWPYIDPVAADGLLTTMNGVLAYASGFRADSQAYTGAWINSRVEGRKEEDRTTTILQTLTKGKTTTDSTDADLENITGDPNHVGFKVRRAWHYMLPTSADTAAVALNGKLLYTGGFRADNQPYTGRYVASGVGGTIEEDRTVTLHQTLTKVKTTRDSGDADLISIDGDPQKAGTLITRAWNYIDPTSTDSLYNVLKAIQSYSAGIKADAQLYAGKYVVQAVRPIGQEDRTVQIQQSLKRVVPVTSDTSLMNPIIAREKEIVHPFSEGRGTRWALIFRYVNLDAATDTKCMALADTALEKKMDATKVYDLIDRKTQEEDDGTLSFYLLARKHARTGWTTTSYASPTRKAYVNRGRPHEQRRLYWYGINKDHHDSVVGDLVDASSDTGFRTIRVDWQDDDDLYAKDYVWTQIKKSTDTRTDSSIENTHGKEHAAILEKRYTYDDYARNEIPASAATPSGYAIERTQVQLNANGLIDKRVVFSKTNASNGVTSGVPARWVAQSRSDQSATRTLDFTGKKDDKLADRVNVRAADSVVKAWSQSPDTHYITEQASYADYGDGTARVTARRFRVNDSGKFYWEEAQAGLGNYSAQIRRVWPYIRDTKAVALMTPGSTATDSATYDGDTYQHLSVRRTTHFNGLSTVTQSLMIPSQAFNATSGDPGTSTGADSLVEVRWGIRSNVQKRYYIYTKEFAKESDAITFARNGGELGTAFLNPPNYIEGYVRTIKKGRYKAFRFSYAAV